MNFKQYTCLERVVKMYLILQPLVLMLSISLSSACLADGFSKTIEVSGIKFSQYDVDDPTVYHQEPIASPDGKYIAFIKVDTQNNTRKLWLLDRERNVSWPLTDQQLATEAYPKWAPDGRLIAYTALAENRTSVRIVSIDTRVSKEITDRHLGSLFSVASTWSADGKKLCFNARTLNAHQLLLYDIGSGLTEVIFESDRIEWPAWSKDDDQIFFAGEMHESGDLWLLNIDSKATKKINTDGFTVVYPALSGDKKWIAFQAREPSSVGESPHVYVVDASGGVPKKVTDNSNFSMAITVAWDSKPNQLLFTGQLLDIGLNHAIAIVDTAGTKIRVLKEFSKQSNSVWWNNTPSWSPDGSMLGFTHGSSDSTKVMIVSVEDGKILYEFNGFGQDFSPDGKEIVTVREDRLWTVVLGDNSAYPVTLGEQKNITHPLWSPDGEWISYKIRNRVRLVSSYGGESEDLIIANGWFDLCGWAKNSKHIFYEKDGSIWSQELYTDNSIRENFNFIESMGWGWANVSPSGDIVAYNRASDFNLHIVRRGQSVSKTITNRGYTTHGLGRPSFSPNGSELAIFMLPKFFTKTIVADITSLLATAPQMP